MLDSNWSKGPSVDDSRCSLHSQNSLTKQREVRPQTKNNLNNKYFNRFEN